jgi:hypothetical protein
LFGILTVIVCNLPMRPFRTNSHANRTLSFERSWLPVCKTLSYRLTASQQPFPSATVLTSGFRNKMSGFRRGNAIVPCQWSGSANRYRVYIAPSKQLAKSL